MKLVELLAKELVEWADTTVCYVQDSCGDIWPCIETAFRDGDSWGGNHGLVDQNDDAEHFGDAEVCDDHETAIVTRAQWQAERDRQKGGEWKRHRGGKCPVNAGTKVITRYRDGVVSDWCMTRDPLSSQQELDAIWSHSGGSADIMAYKIEPKDNEEISQPQAEEVEVKDTTIGTLSYKVEIDTTEASQAIDALAAKWDQVDGPLLWRDTVNELDAYIEKYTRERDALIERLASEGFALIPPVVGVVSEFSGVDMSDWRNWKAGDVVEVVESFDNYDSGALLCVEDFDDADIEMPVALQGKKGRSWPCPSQIKFHSRP